VGSLKAENASCGFNTSERIVALEPFLGHFGEIGPTDCGPGKHFIAVDLERIELEGLRPKDVTEDTHTSWLWAEINYALRWDVPRR